MKRCFFISSSWRDKPVSRQFRALMSRLVEHGHQVVMLVDHHQQDVVSSEGNPIILTWPSYRPTKLKDAIFLLKLIRHHRPDCLIASSGSVNIMTLVGWLMRVPNRVAWYHTMSEAGNVDGQESPLRMNLMRTRKRFVYGLSTHVIAGSQATINDAERFMGVDARKCHILPYSVDDPYQLFPKLNNVSWKPNLLVCVGRFTPTKGQDIVLKAAKLLIEHIPDLRIEFIGDGPSKVELLQLAEELGIVENCVFLSGIPYEDVLTRMASATSTVLGSRSDSFPLVIIESMAVGTPVVATQVGGIPIAIQNGFNGFLVPTEDPIMMAKQLSLLLSNSSLRNKLGAHAREKFLDNYEVKAVADLQANWFENLVN